MQRWVQHCLGKRVSFVSCNHDGTIVALNKSSGVYSHPNEHYATNTLIKGSYEFNKEMYATQDGGGQLINTYLLHRLDKDTSGVVLVARSDEEAKHTKRLFQHRLVHKEYCALVLGNCSKDLQHMQVWEDSYESRYVMQGKAIRAQIPIAKHGSCPKIARTQVTVVKHLAQFGITCLRLYPITGFAHQLRFQCANRGLPILGDDVYGDFAMNKQVFKRIQQLAIPGFKRLYLHAHRIRLGGGGTEQFEAAAPLPATFRMLIGSAREPCSAHPSGTLRVFTGD
jgi:tRNA pseudouridine65 synthase